MLTVYERKQLNNKNYENYFKAISNSNTFNNAIPLMWLVLNYLGEV